MTKTRVLDVRIIREYVAVPKKPKDTPNACTLERHTSASRHAGTILFTNCWIHTTSASRMPPVPEYSMSISWAVAVLSFASEDVILRSSGEINGNVAKTFTQSLANPKALAMRAALVAIRLVSAPSVLNTFTFWIFRALPQYIGNGSTDLSRNYGSAAPSNPANGNFNGCG
jgi:hypothetical protein